MTRPLHGSSSPPVVLFYTDNGFGLGHLTRLAAVASRARGRFQPVFLTMSAGFPLLRELGFPGEYFPSYGHLGIPRDQWEPLIAERVLEAIQLNGASVVVVDHVSPPRIIDWLRSRAEGVKFVWSRRGLWQPGTNRGALQLSENFDLIVEPGDLASPIDHGPTVTRRHETKPTEPVVLVDRDEFLTRDEARDHLGIPRSGRAVLINLGDVNVSEVEASISHARSILKMAANDRIHTFAPLHPLHGGRLPTIEKVTMAPVYPVALYLNAFDGIVCTAGYNSFHETVGSGIPAVFIPRGSSRIDDQRRRAEFAALSGRAHWAPGISDPAFLPAAKRMLRGGEREVAEKTTTALGTMRGAHEFADILAEAADATTPAPTESVNTALATGGDGVSGRVEPEARSTLVAAVEHDDEQLLHLVDSIPETNFGKTILLVRDGDPAPLYHRGVVFESVMTESEWSVLSQSSYSDYVDARIAGIMRRYNTARMIAPPPGSMPQLGDQIRSTG